MPPDCSIASHTTADERSQPAYPGGVGTASSAAQVLVTRPGGAAPAPAPSVRTADITVSRAVDRMGRPAARAERALYADEQAVPEVRLELRVEDLLGRRLDVVVGPLELEDLGLGVIDGVAGARVVVA